MTVPPRTRLQQVAAPPVFVSTLTPREPPLAAPVWFLGVDPTAGDPTADYERGKKPTACVLLREDAAGLHLDRVERLHENAEIVSLAESVAGPVVVAVDGPCMDVPQGRTGRPCEREVQRMGLSLYLSGGNQFAGVRDWMRRSFRLFAAFERAGYALHGTLPVADGDTDALLPRTVAEVYPAVGFALAAGYAPDAPRKLPKKGVRAGDDYRAAVLAALGLDLSAVRSPGPRHDLHDAAISALTAYLATRARARWLGDKADGGGMLVPLPVLREED